MAKAPNVGEAHNGLVGKWRHILEAAGMDPKDMKGNHKPCPMCGGNDRFRFDDAGVGRFYCSQCGSGDGFKLLMHYTGRDFKGAMDYAREIAGVVDADAPRKEEDAVSKRRRLNGTWKAGQTTSDGLFAYLEGRDIDRDLAVDPALRWHPMLQWYGWNGESKVKGSDPAMLARYFQWDKDGKREAVTIHRIWPKGPPKLKMVMPSPVEFNGIWCPLGGMPAKGGRMGVCEGVETALSCMTIDRIIDRPAQPWWSTYSSEELKKFKPPIGIQQLDIGVDIDYSFTGQAAGYELARRLRRDRPEIAVRIIRPRPHDSEDENDNFDFNDLLRKMRAAKP